MGRGGDQADRIDELSEEGYIGEGWDGEAIMDEVVETNF